MTIRPVPLALLALLLPALACGGGDDDIVLPSAPATAPPTSDLTTSTTTPTPPSSGRTVDADVSVAIDADVSVAIDASTPGAAISPAILGLSSALSMDELRQAGVQVDSWGGNTSTRYNYDLGNAWNNGADWEFRNTDFGNPPGDLAVEAVKTRDAAGVQMRLAIPTLGWVAKDTSTDTCSFPSGGGCLGPSAVGNCKEPKLTADPTTANVESTPQEVGAWLHRMADAGASPEYIAMDNEPELWGGTHYDVHPACSTYEEILDKYLTYATVAKEAFPDAALTGPVLCCWFDYWHTAPGPADGSDVDFVSWFLDSVRAHDEATGVRSLDYLDVHYYPQTGVYPGSDTDDAETNAKRLRSTRSLWDIGYIDESWINDRIQFIPRMRSTIRAHYPGTKLFISEWNFGADATINGALAIADVLGIYGREGVEAATYWRNPEVGSPGWFAFTMHGNYDGRGSRFGGAAVPAATTDAARIGSYAALDDASGVLRVMLVNRDPDATISVALDVAGFSPAADVARYVYGPANPQQIVADQVPVGSAISLPASSITVLELARTG